MAHRGDFHSFSTLVAKQCGVNAAIVLRHLDFWIEKNRANKENFRDGRYWTYSSMNGFCDILDYLSPKQIRTAIEKLEQEGYIIRGNYNSSGYDRKTWYAIIEAGYAAFGVGGESNPVAASDESPSPDEQGETTDEGAEESVPVCPDGSSAAAEKSTPFAAEGKSICPDGQMELPPRANGFAAEGKSIRGEDIATDNIPPNPPAGGTEGASPAEPVAGGDAGNSRSESVPADETGKAPDADFDRFWAAYPRKEGKGAARKAFGKARRKAALEAMLSAVELQKRSPQWSRDDGRYIPMPATWLNQERWGDSPNAGRPNDAGCPRPEQPPGGTRKKTYRELIQERNARKEPEYGRVPKEANKK